MTVLEWLIAAAGATATVLVVLGMILLAPSNAPSVPDDASTEATELSTIPVAAE
jgi:hypothetical protein